MNIREFKLHNYAMLNIVIKYQNKINHLRSIFIGGRVHRMYKKICFTLLIVLAMSTLIACPENLDKIGCDACILFQQSIRDSIYDFETNLINENGDTVPTEEFWNDTVTLSGHKLKWKNVGTDNLLCDHTYHFEVVNGNFDSKMIIKLRNFDFTCKNDWKSYQWDMNVIRENSINNYHLSVPDSTILSLKNDTIELESPDWVK